jgi:hypothetical protein
MASLSDKERADLVAYLDGELDEAAARAVEVKLNLDPQARADVVALRKTWELLDYLPRAEPSPSFTHRTLERLTGVRKPVPLRRERWPWWSVAAAWAAAALLAAALGFIGTNRVTGPRDASPITEKDEQKKRHTFETMSDEEIDQSLVRNLRIVENKRLYENVEDMEFLQKLDNPDLFGEVDVE